MIRSLRVALSFMTTLPLPQVTVREEEVRQSVRAYPLVGLLLGLLLLAAFALLAPLPPLVRAVLVVGLWLLMTGALHLDGLCDVADAAFASKSPEERQRIAKDPSVGVFALAAGVILLLFKVSLLSTSIRGPWLVVALVLSRTLVVLPMARFSSHNLSRLGRQARISSVELTLPLALGLGLSGVWAWLLLDLWDWLFTAAVAGAVVVSLASWLAHRMEGLGGDAFGALIEVGETTVLLAALLMEGS